MHDIDGEKMNKPVAAIIIMAIIAASIMAVPQPAEASLNVIIVPDDFPTINQAIQNATDGDTVLIRQGNYSENIVIDKAITLTGTQTNKTTLKANNTGPVIQIRHVKVTVTRLTIQYSEEQISPKTHWVRYLPKYFGPDDIHLLRAAMLAKPGDFDASGYPKDHGYENDYGVRPEGILLHNVSYCIISGNRILDCGSGVRLRYSAHNIVAGNEFVRNDYGLHLEGSNNNNITANTFSKGAAGIYFDPILDYPNNYIADPLNANNTFAKNNFIDNQQHIERIFLTNTIKNYWDNGKQGNYWSSNSGGVNDNNDGVDDTPYKIFGEFYTGGENRKGVWVVQTHGVDNYPLMEPFDTASMFTVYTPPPPQQPTPNITEPVTTTLTIVITGITIATATGLAVYFIIKKRQQS